MSRLPAILERRSLTPGRAAAIIAGYTLVVTVAGGLLARLLDHKDFHSVGEGLWWSLQTVTTVGYGDVVPHDVNGRVLGVIVMLSGIGFLTVIGAAVTAALIESVRQRMRSQQDAELQARLEDISARLSAIERKLGDRG